MAFLITLASTIIADTNSAGSLWNIAVHHGSSGDTVIEKT